MIETPHHLAAAGIPQIGAVVVAAGEGVAAIGGEIHRIDLLGMAEELQPAPGAGIHQLRLAIFTADQHQTAIGRECRIPQAGFRK